MTEIRQSKGTIILTRSSSNRPVQYYTDINYPLLLALPFSSASASNTSILPTSSYSPPTNGIPVSASISGSAFGETMGFPCASSGTEECTVFWYLWCVNRPIPGFGRERLDE